jgi:hypothetical protein
MKAVFNSCRGSLFSLFLVLSLLGTAIQSNGQSTTGSIVGRVTDASEGSVPGAKVTAVNLETGISYGSITAEDGNYAVHGLPPGKYTVTVQKDGFEKATSSDVVLVIDQKQLLNFSLKVGAVTDSITVSVAPTMLQTQSVETGEVIQSHEILDLPLLGRNFYNLTALTAGVIQVGGSINSFAYSVNGQREYANSVQVDGIEATTNRTQDITAAPSVDSVQEFKVSTSAYSAQFGNSAGGDVSIQTKSGTNNYHGTLYDFYRPSFTTAKDYGFNAAKIPASILNQNNYGGTVGGPIFKNKTFFFASYEGVQMTNAYNYVYLTPPMNQIKVLPNGSVDLSGLKDPTTGGQIPIYDPTVSLNCYGGCYQQFPGNIIPANRVSQAGLNTLLNFFPAPNLPGTSNGWYNNYQVHSPVSANGRSADARLDHNFSDNDRLSFIFHYGYGNNLVTDPYWGHTVVSGAGDGDQGNNQNSGSQEYVLAETHVFSTRLINEARFGYLKYNLSQYSLLNGTDYSTKYGLGNINVPGFPATQAFPWIFMGDGEVLGGSTYKPFLIQDNNFQILDNVTYNMNGKNEFHFGGSFRRLNSHPNFSLFPTSFFYFGGPYAAMTSDWSYTSPLDNFGAFYGTGGADIADLILGLPLDVQRGLQLTKPHTQSWEMSYYAEDTIRLTPRLTATLGVRYELQAPYTEAGNNQANYNPATDSFLLAGRGGNSASLVNSRWNDVAPRVGFAYQIKPTLVLRAGYGLFYTPENDAREDILTKNYPFAEQAVFTNNPYNGPASATQPFTYVMDTGIPRNTAIPIPPGASSIPSSMIQNGNLLTSYYEYPKNKTGYAELYNVALQWEFINSMTLEAAYVGASSHRLSYEVGNLNRKNDAGNPTITPNLGIIQGLTDSGWAGYNSMQVKVTKRASANLSFLASYTYGHNIDNGPAPFNLGHINNDNPQDPYNLNLEKASADSDVRHNFVFSGLYRLPIGNGQRFFSGWSRTAQLLMGGWQLNAIFVAHTGTPINVIRNGSDVGYEGLRPNIIGNPLLPQKGLSPLQEYFNTATCTQQPCSSQDAWDISPFSGTNAHALGNAGRNLFYGPGYVNVDASIFKDFAIKESMKIQTRFEVFNASNSPHFANPGGDMGNGSSFGQITRTYGNMRIVQLAAKFIF